MSALAAGQKWDADKYEQNTRFVSDLGMPVVEWLAPQPSERILDLACGDGALTEKLAALAGEVVGVDASPEFVQAACTRGLDVRLMDGYALSFSNEFDAVFSNAALHWMKHDPDAVIAGVYRALKLGGRFVAECGGMGNVASIRVALHAVLRRRGIDPLHLDPWYFAPVDEYRQRLERGGFQVKRIELIPRPTPLPGDISGWLDTMAGAFTMGMTQEQCRELIGEIRELLEPALCDAQGRWTADYVRLRFVALR